jgi:hypothetical protein
VPQWQKRLQYWQEVLGSFDLGELASGKKIPIQPFGIKNESSSNPQYLRPVHPHDVAGPNYEPNELGWWLIFYTEGGGSRAAKVFFGIPLGYDPEKGIFVPPSNARPLFNRNWMEPANPYAQQNGYLCDITDYGRWFEQNPYPPADEDSPWPWPDYWDYCRRMVQELTGKPLELIHHAAGEDRSELWPHVFPGQASFLGRHIKALEAALQGSAPLLRTLVDPGVPQPVLAPLELSRARQKHLAHMDTYDVENAGRKGFALERSQRQAVQHLQVIPEENLLAVNGPPGTGKTSFLRSVIASLWVQAALDGSDCPIILATASTNKAVTNIIQSFSEIPGPERESQWMSRWLPGLPSYGWFLPAKSRPEDYRKNYMALRKTVEENHVLLGSGLAERFFQEVATGTDAMKAEYLRLHAGCVGLANTLPTIQEAVRDIHQRLQDSAARMHGIQQRIEQLIRDRLALSATWAQEEKYRLQYSGLGKSMAEIEEQISALKRDLADRTRARDLVVQSWQQYVQRQHAANQQQAISRLAQEISESLQALKQNDVRDSSPSFWSRVFGSKAERERSQQRQQLLAEQERRLNAITQAPPPRVDPPADLAHLNQAIASLQEQIAARQGTLSQYRELSEKIKAALMPLDQFRARLRSESDLLLQELTSPEVIERLRALDTPVVSAEDCAEIFRISEELLDQQFRFLHFHMAARYWEGRWLETPLAHSTDNLDAHVGHLHHLAMLAPVIVATVHTLPAIGGKEGAYAFADLLIFDEAGQTTPELGAAAFAFAKRAIVVGDVYQLEPIWSLAAPDEKFLLDSLGIDESSGGEQGPCVAAEYSASQGSVMRMAQRASAYGPADLDKGYPAGLSLTAHYRCRRTIIEYCKELIYRDDLQPMRDDKSRYCPYPPMSWVAVAKSQAQKQQGSWINEGEIKEILGWLVDEKDRLLDLFPGKELAQIVAIIAPFRAQAELIRERVSKHPALGDTLAKSMIINTVHALQGAEIPVVAFSVTQTAAPFFANGGDPVKPNLLNVAVSRAQEAFILFAAPQVLEAETANKKEPLGLLVDYLRRRGQRLYPRELVIIESPQKAEHFVRALGRSVRILATAGHFVDIATWPKGEAPEWTENAQGFPQSLQQELLAEGQYDHLILATDDDTDGEEIAWHVLRHLQEKGSRLGERALRMRFLDLEPQTIRQAREAARPGLQMTRVKGSLLKRLADYRFAEFTQAKLGRRTGRNQLAVLDHLDNTEKQRPERRYRVMIEGQCAGQRLVTYQVQGESSTAPAVWMTREEAWLVAGKLQKIAAMPLLGVRSIERDYPRFPAQTTARFYISGWRRYGWRPEESAQHLQYLYYGRYHTVVKQAGEGEA